MRNAYYYLFYRIYRVVEKSSKTMGGAFFTDFKAVCLLIILEIYLLFSIGIYWTEIGDFNIELRLELPIVYVPLILVIGLNSIAFGNRKVWQRYVAEFERWPKRKNVIGGWIVVSLMSLLVANFIFAFYLLSH
jgi:hypothetical protein